MFCIFDGRLNINIIRLNGIPNLIARNNYLTETSELAGYLEKVPSPLVSRKCSLAPVEYPSERSTALSRSTPYAYARPSALRRKRFIRFD